MTSKSRAAAAKGGSRIEPIPPHDRLYGAELTALVGLSAGRLAGRNGFPKPRQLAPGSWSWSRTEVEKYLAEHGKPRVSWVLKFSAT